jgi:hypothetical protein
VPDNAVLIEHPAKPPADHASAEVRYGLDLGFAQCRQRVVGEVQADELQQIACADREVRAAGRAVVGNRPFFRRNDLCAGLDVADRGTVQDRLVGVGSGGLQAQWRYQAFAECVVEGLVA